MNEDCFKSVINGKKISFIIITALDYELLVDISNHPNELIDLHIPVFEADLGHPSSL